MELQATTALLYLINGDPQAGAVPGLMVSPPPPRPARGRQNDTLYLHLTLSGPAAETDVLAQDLLDSISSRFFRTTGSVTAALRKAIVETNELLLRRNMSGTDMSREGALICAVQRNGELFMAQVGEAFAIMGHNFGVEKMPAESPTRITPMGRTAGLDIRFYHNWLEPTDTLLLADPRISHLPIDSIRPALVDTTIQGGIDALQTQLVADTARLMLIEFTDEEPFDMPTEITGTTESGDQLSLTTTTPQREVPTRRPTITLPDIPIADTARQAGSHAMMGMGKLTGWVAKLMATLRPPSDEPPEEPETYLFAGLIAIILPILVTITIMGAYFRFGQTQDISNLRQQMRDGISTASLAITDDERLVAYNRVVALASEADALRRDDPEVNRLRSDALLGLDRLEGITRLKGQVLFEYDADTILSSIAIREDDVTGEIYILDETTNQVWLHHTSDDYLTLTTPEPERILHGDQAIGSRTVGTILDIRWYPTGSNNATSGIAMLDGFGTLIDYDSLLQAYTAVPLRLASDWRIPRQFTFFNDRLYLLDAGTNGLWRYFPQVSGYDLQGGQETVNFNDPNTLAGVRDVDIYNEDGNIILLYEDGRMSRYAGINKLWDEQDLAARGLQSPLIAPTAVHIVGRGTVSSIFVSDPALERIVQVALGGNYLAQFRATDESGRELFTDIQDFVVTENPFRIIAIADNKLIVASQ